MKPTIVNCVGVGHWGPNLVRVFSSHPDSRVRAVCDLDPGRLERTRQNLRDVEIWSTDVRATIADPEADAVIVATPTSTHYELAKAALLAGKHVLIEKPLARKAEEAEELIALSKKAGKVLAVGHVFLFNAGIRAVREIIRSGSLGRLYYLNAVRTNLGPVRRDVNALWDLAAHDLSIFDYWLGAAPISVTAHGESFLNPGVEDVVIAALGYPGGVTAHVHASWLNPRKVREITVVGERAMAVWNDMDLGEPVRVYHKGVEADQRYADSFGAFQMLVRNGDVVIPHVAGSEPLAAEGAHFLDCVRGGSEPINGGAVGLAVVRALEAADRSIASGSLQVPVTPVSKRKD